MPKVDSDLSVNIVVGDIMLERADAIVNPANKELTHGGGLCGVIFNAIQKSDPSGQNYRQIMEEIENIEVGNGRIRCPTGDAVLTSAPGLAFKAIIHSVGPIAAEHSEAKQRKLIKSCYYECLKLADINRFKTVSLPLISAGIYGCDKQLVADSALEGCDQFLEEFPMRYLRKVNIMVLEPEDAELF